MPTTPATGDTTARTIEDRFLDLICSDADLLAAEFDAIIAAQWPEPPTATPGRGTAGRHPGSNAARRVADPARGRVARPPQPGIGGSARQRSPPATTPDARQAEKHAGIL
jgi:hypothetical protein